MTTETILTDNLGLIEQLREYAANNGYSHNDYADTMSMAADALERHEKAALQSPEIQALRRDAEAYKWAIKNASWLRHEHVAYVAVPVHVDANLSCPAFRVDAIRAAMEQQT